MNSLTQHQKKLLHAIADDKQLQYYDRYTSRWNDVPSQHCLTAILEQGDITKYRIAPHTVRIGDIRIECAISDALHDGVEYYTPAINHINLYASHMWQHNALDSFRLNSGVIHLIKENAIAHAKALLSLTTIKESNKQ